MTNPVPTMPVSRRSPDDGSNTAAPEPEVRWICVAQGIQATNANYRQWIVEAEADSTLTPEERQGQMAALQSHIVPQCLQEALPELTPFDLYGSDAGLYYSPVQNIMYVIMAMAEKSAYLSAIQTPDLIVIYLGHARYGRGPCFGPDPAPSNDWEDGTDPATRGIFRMGFPVLGVPVHEILQYGYTPHLLETAAGRPAAQDCDPDLRSHRSQLHGRPIAQLHHDPASLAQLAHQIGRPVDDPTEYWTYDAMESGKFERHLVLRAGWEHTSSGGSDLGSATPQCRAFLHLGCSTFIHNYPVMRRLKGWTRDGDDRFAYWTTAPATAASLNPLLRHLLTYPYPNAQQPWEPWLRWAVQRTNQDLRAQGCTFRLI